MKKVYVNEEQCLGCHPCEFYCAFANSGGIGVFGGAKKRLEVQYKWTE